MRFKEMRKEYKSAKTKAEKNFIIEQYSESLMNTTFGCLVLLFLLLLFVGIIA